MRTATIVALGVLCLIGCAHSVQVEPLATDWNRAGWGAELKVIDYADRTTLPIRWIARVEADNTSDGVNLVQLVERVKVAARAMGADGIAIASMGSPMKRARLKDLGEPWTAAETVGMRNVIAMVFVYTDGRAQVASACNGPDDCYSKGEAFERSGTEAYDLSRAIAFYQRDCEIGSRPSCVRARGLAMKYN